MDDRSIDDGDFEYEKPRSAQRVLVSNRPHDEELSVSVSTDEDSVVSADSVSGLQATAPQLSTTGTSTSKPNYDDLSSNGKDHPVDSDSKTASKTAEASATFGASTEQRASFSGGYDSKKYDGLSVDPAIKQLFSFIGRYQPRKQQIVSELKPFIPDYIAAIGDVDEFLKPPRPDGKFERLGLEVLDEPSANQSDPAILRKVLRSRLKGAANEDDVDDHCISQGDPDRESKIDQWIKSVEALRDDEAASEFKYEGRFPTMDSLVSTWPEELEPLVRNLRTPGPHLDMPTPTLARALCALLDIPFHGDIVDSLHCMFMLYHEMKSNEMINPSEPLVMAMPGKPNFVRYD